MFGKMFGLIVLFFSTLIYVVGLVSYYSLRSRIRNDKRETKPNTPKSKLR